MSSKFVSFLRRKITFMQFMLSKEFIFPFYTTNCHHLLNIEATGSSDFWSTDAVTPLLCFPYFVNALEVWATPPWHCTLPESPDLCGTWYLLLTLSACQTKAQKLSRRKYSDIFVTTKEGIRKVCLVGHHGVDQNSVWVEEFRKDDFTTLRKARNSEILRLFFTASLTVRLPEFSHSFCKIMHAHWLWQMTWSADITFTPDFSSWLTSYGLLKTPRD